MQRETGEAYISSQAGWRHVDHYEDVGLSGYDPNVYRPDFERLLTDAKAGKFDVVVIYMLSRLTRQGAAEALRIQQELSKCGVALVSTQEPFINTSDDNPFGVAFFALIAGLAHQESKNKSKFIRDSFAKLRAKGSHSSGPVPHGFYAESVNEDGVTVRFLRPRPPGDPAGDSVRRMIELAQEGRTESRIATMLTEEKVPTPLAALGAKGRERTEFALSRRKTGDDAPAEWSPTVVRRILRDPRLAGFAIAPVEGGRGKVRKILRDDHGEPVRPHEGFMDPTDWYALQATFDGRKREVRRDRINERTFLGSWGMTRCGKCGSGMTVSRPDMTYVCNLRRSVGDVPRHVLRVGMDAADRTVAERLWAHIRGLDPVEDERGAELLVVASERFAARNADPEAAEESAEQEAQLEHVQQSQRELYEDRRQGLYDGPVGRREFASTAEKYRAHEQRCTARIAELREAATATTEIPLSAWQDGDPFGPEGIWTRMTVEERRAFLSVWVDSVTVAPAESRRQPPADRVTVDWATRQEEAEEEAPDVA